MKRSKILKGLLIISGLIASTIGAAILFAPVEFYASYGMRLNDVNLLNELSASGGALLASGMLITLGAFVDKLAFTATIVSALLYLSYGLSRVVSIAMNGVPIEGLVQAAILEIVIGLACVFAFIKYQGKQKELANDSNIQDTAMSAQ